LETKVPTQHSGHVSGWTHSRRLAGRWLSAFLSWRVPVLVRRRPGPQRPQSSPRRTDGATR